MKGSAGTQGVKFRGAGRGGGGAAGRLIQDYSIVPGRRNWQIETAAWIWPSFFHCALETRWLGVRKTCGIGLFYRNYRPLLQETGWLVSDFISVRLETRWLGQKKWFLCPGSTLYPLNTNKLLLLLLLLGYCSGTGLVLLYRYCVCYHVYHV